MTTSFALFSQSLEPDKPPIRAWLKDRIYTGGGLGLGFSSLGGNLQLAPIVGLKLTNKLHTGVRGTYWYHWGKAYDDLGAAHKYAGSIAALSLFGRLFVTNNVFLHVEPEWMNLPTYTLQPDQNSLTYILKEKRTNAFNFYLGGGLFQSTGGNSGLFAMLLYNVNQTKNSLYANPMIQVGFAIGF